jgi:CHAT domain-containing protein
MSRVPITLAIASIVTGFSISLVFAQRLAISEFSSTVPLAQAISPEIAGDIPTLQPQPEAGSNPVFQPQITTSLTNRETSDVTDPATAIRTFEEFQANDVVKYFGFALAGEIVDVDCIGEVLGDLSRVTGQKAALIYVISRADALDLILVLPTAPATTQTWRPTLDTSLAAATLIASRVGWGLMGQATPKPTEQRSLIIRKRIPAASAQRFKAMAQEFRREISDPRNVRSTSYLTSAQQLHQWIIAPLLPDLQAHQIKTLIFCLDKGFRAFPVAALHDGQKFLVENYSLALIPSFSLTDTRYATVRGSQLLGMGISESIQGQAPLPIVAIEVPTLTQKIWQGQSVLNQNMTIANLKSLTASQRFKIIHLATHGEFKPGHASTSYLQFWDAKLNINQLREIALQAKWNRQPIDLLVLSACQTALGDPEAELGFAGLAVNTGAKAALGSLWYVSDEGALGLMSKFYEQLKITRTKAEAFRQAQLVLLRGRAQVVNGELTLPNQSSIALPKKATSSDTINLSHPYYWSAFVLVGNWN